MAVPRSPGGESGTSRGQKKNPRTPKSAGRLLTAENDPSVLEKTIAVQVYEEIYREVCKEVAGEAFRRYSVWGDRTALHGLEILFRYLTPAERAKARLVCQVWKRAANNPMWWDFLDLNFCQPCFPEPPCAWKGDNAETGGGTTSVSLSLPSSISHSRAPSSWMSAEGVMKILAAARKNKSPVKVLRLPSYPPDATTDEVLEAVATHCGAFKKSPSVLHTLDMSFCRSVSGDGLSHLLPAVANTLHVVDLSGCAGIRGENVMQLCEGLRRLSALYCGLTSGFTDEILAKILQHRKDTLKQLGLRGCRLLTDQALVHIRENLAYLQYLDIGKCPQIGNAGLQALSSKMPTASTPQPPAGENRSPGPSPSPVPPGADHDAGAVSSRPMSTVDGRPGSANTLTDAPIPSRTFGKKRRYPQIFPLGTLLLDGCCEVSSYGIRTVAETFGGTLRFLSLGGTSDCFLDDWLAPLSAFCPGLLSLVLDRVPGLQGHGIRTLMQTIPLHSLTIKYAPDLTDSAFLPPFEDDTGADIDADENCDRSSIEHDAASGIQAEDSNNLASEAGSVVAEAAEGRARSWESEEPPVKPLRELTLEECPLLTDRILAPVPPPEQEKLSFCVCEEPSFLSEASLSVVPSQSNIPVSASLGASQQVSLTNLSTSSVIFPTTLAHSSDLSLETSNPKEGEEDDDEAVNAILRPGLPVPPLQYLKIRGHTRFRPAAIAEAVHSALLHNHPLQLDCTDALEEMTAEVADGYRHKRHVQNLIHAEERRAVVARIRRAAARKNQRPKRY
eukprot:Rmarinus@m.23366